MFHYSLVNNDYQQDSRTLYTFVSNKTFGSLLQISSKLDLRRGQKTVALSNLSIYYTWKNVKTSYNNNKFKISAPTWSEEFELPDGSYSVSDIQDYFEYILKKHSESVHNPSIRMYINRIENRITFKIKN